MGPHSDPDPDYVNRPLNWPATVTISTGHGTRAFQLVLGSATPRDELRRLIRDAEDHDEPVTRIVVEAGTGDQTVTAQWQPGRIDTHSHTDGWATQRRADTDPAKGVDEAIAAAGADGRPLCEYCDARAQRRVEGPAGRWACRAHRHLSFVDARRHPGRDSPIHLDDEGRIVVSDSAERKTATCWTCGHVLVIDASLESCPLCSTAPAAEGSGPGFASTSLCEVCRYGRHPHPEFHPSYCRCPCRLDSPSPADEGARVTGDVEGAV